jgi:hypothetical protein
MGTSVSQKKIGKGALTSSSPRWRRRLPRAAATTTSLGHAELSEPLRNLLHRPATVVSCARCTPVRRRGTSTLASATPDRKRPYHAADGMAIEREDLLASR